MSRDGAMARARALRDELVRRGVPTSIEIMQGRPGTPNGRWFDTRFIGTMGHHIVSRRSQGLTPGLALVKRGRPDVPGPLCNGYLGFDGRARIICMGWANHPGAGGAYTLPGGRVPRDNGRPYFFGWEIEGGIVASDWTPSFRTLMGKVHAATLAWLGRDERSHIEHKTWAPTRKIDRLNYTLSSARAELKPHLSGTSPKEWWEMAIPDSDLKKIAKAVIAELDHDVTDNLWAAQQGILNPGTRVHPKTALRNAWAMGKDARSRIIAVAARQEANTALLAQLVERDPSTPLTADDVRRVVDEAIAEGVVKVQVSIGGAHDDENDVDGED